VMPDELLTAYDRDASDQDRYDDLKQLQAEIITFVAQVEKHELNESESRALNRAVHAARLALYSAKGLKDVKRNIDAFADGGVFLDRFHGMLRKRTMASHMRIAKALEPEGLKDPTLELAALLRQLEEDDKKGMLEVSNATRDGQLRNMDLSTALLVNRALVRSSHDLVLAVAELTLPPEEFHTLERVQEVEEALARPEA
jgi:phosphate:Na+ symporter